MASLNGLYVVMAFMISFNLLINTSLSYDKIQSSQGHAPRPLSAYEKYLSDCSQKLKPHCGQQIFFSVFIGNQTVSNDCCLSLVNDMGKSCHVDLTRYAVQLPLFKKNQTQILNRCKKVWTECSYVLSPSSI
ncbi:hypothetical protein RJT34_01691 [Clitoria ternatea]|uniref:Prolamin-like domain-containing protein n=1 Tax=Clitoria ternatea TaxID=43366 RepID=A0AAN9KGZ5_CLITE